MNKKMIFALISLVAISAVQAMNAPLGYQVNPPAFQSILGNIIKSNQAPEVQPDGKLIYEAITSEGRLVRTRYNADRTLDQTFGVNGIEYGPYVGIGFDFILPRKG